MISEATLEEIVKCHCRQWQSAAFRVTGNSSDTDDIVQSARAGCTLSDWSDSVGPVGPVGLVGRSPARERNMSNNERKETMSKDNVKKFYEALKADKALAEELRNAVNAVVIQFAAKQNLAFTAEELVEFETEARKLSDEELDQVNAAGGGTVDPPRTQGADTLPFNLSN